MNNSLDEKIINNYINDNLNLRFMLFDCVGSTNLLMKEYSHEEEGLVIVASQQTDGRGRLGNRRFFSPPGAGLYVSILLKPKSEAGDATMITSMAAVAVCRTIETFIDKRVEIKWVNDIYIDGKKACGILTQGEVNREGGLNHAILGIGVNLYPPKEGFPEELSDIATTVFDGEEEMTNRFLAALLNNLFTLYRNSSRTEVAREYRGKNLVINRNITVLLGDKSYNAYVIDIDDSCNLILETEDGERRTLQSGEVSVRV